MIGLVLAGGKSSRFGQDKALYRYPNQKVNNVEVTVNKLLMVCNHVLISTNTQNYSVIKRQFSHLNNVDVIVDQEPFKQHGPLSGIYAASCQNPQTTDYLLVAVDYPLLSPSVISIIASNPNSYAATPKNSHYAISHFQVSKRTLHDYLLFGDFRLSHFIIDSRRCLPISFPSYQSFLNLNSPEVQS